MRFLSLREARARRRLKPEVELQRADPRVIHRETRRVAIVTTGRFHVLDLARELDSLGYDVCFYSYVRGAECDRYGVPRSSCINLLPYVFPVAIARKAAPRRFRHKAAELSNYVVDQLAATMLTPSQVFIGMSGICVASAIKAREYGAMIFVERGSRHILSQLEICALAGTRLRELASQSDIERELWAYDFADVIAVPSSHARQSFLDRGFPRSKLFCNPYGVDLSMFAPTAAPARHPKTVIFVGQWSLQKGCDLLWQACQRAGDWNLLHVGAIADAEVPISSRFRHVDSVPQSQLRSFYAEAHVAVLASRQDGFGMVLSQAAACGLPIVCTDRTGGPDLNQLVGYSEFIHVVPAGDVDALNSAIEQAFLQANTQVGTRDYLAQSRNRLSWHAYAQRYAQEIERRLSDR